MSLQQNKDLVGRFTQAVMNEGRLDELEAYLSPDFLNHVTDQTGIDAYRAVLDWARKLQGDDGVNVIDDLIAEDDRVAMFITVNGRLTNEVRVMGMRFAATGSAFATRQVHTFRIRDGKLQEHWAIRDDLTMLLELGARIVEPDT